MASFSISAAWDDMIGFVRRESSLLVPVALATFGAAGMLMSFAMPKDMPSDAAPVIDARIWLLIPVLLLLGLGNLSVNILALTPGTSVGEALRRGALRLPAMIGAAALFGLAFLIVLIVASIIVVPIAGSAAAGATLLMPIAVLLMLVLGVPALLLSPVIAIEARSPVVAFRRVFELSKGHSLRLFTVLCTLMLVTLSISLIASLVVTAVVKLFALVNGQEMLVELMGDLLLAGVSALLSMVNATYIAFVYRRLAS